MDEKQKSSSNYQICGTGVEQRFKEDNQRCVTRSEIYALVREVINKRKHDNFVTNVYAHIFESGFADQLDYIRANIDKVLIIIGGEQTQRKRLTAHVEKLNKIFNLNTDLETEYRTAAGKYDSHC
ncbi:lef-11 [Alphabaculovirus alterspexiguae]|uniref:Late expression factor 11 n=1 Tax=Spodoptera exigua multiple nucleopolyhedrovirus TaxID=10454 RepID=A0A3G2JU34_9ABAC|nr:lef-11 [Spodoptera exigua multiple nucleopolyhedrovirus]AYN45067.1 lef-11 [Spodoptera exigua multiple nucleopolyhedrovirus]